MKIGINALYLLPGKVGGSETYIRNLVKWLVKIDRENEYVVFINQESVGIFDVSAPHVRVIACPIHATNRPLRILWEQIVLPFQVRHYQIDVLLSAGLTAPFICPATSVLVLYDLQHINQPQNFSRPYLFFLKSIIYWSAKSADNILTISHHVKNDIIRFYHIPPDRITVSHLAVDHDAFFPAGGNDPSSLRIKYDLPEHYILYPAALLPHKNHQRLLQAYEVIKGEIPGTKLVLTGAWDKGRDTIDGMITELSLQNDVIALGWIPFDDIPLLYRRADLFVFPSLHEGFGLPILEAMASGVPVLCSRLEPLTEVAGNAALFIDPHDHADIAKGIVSLLRDNELREKLIKKGRMRAKEFTWEHTAEKTLGLLSKRVRSKH